MCVSPIKIYNKSRRISLDSFTPSYYYVPCGRCCECRSLHRSEWLFRIENEFRSTISAGGCCLFDTLTYAPEWVPYISDFLGDRLLYSAFNRFCFNYKDCQDFIKRLRHTYSFRYILVSEFGTHPFHQHRPHYHVLFFLPKGVDPLKFSVSVADEWKFGRTDGVGRSDGYVYKGYTYVRENRVFDAHTPHVGKIFKYVSKYVSKSFLEDSKLRYNLDCIMVALHGPKWNESLKYRLERTMLYNHVCQRHLQSIRFGDVDDATKQKSIEQDCFVVNTDDGPIRFPIFRSFRRRWFYDKLKWKGFEYWQPNKLGIGYLMKRFDKLVEQQKLRFDSLIPSLPDVKSKMDNIGVDTQLLSEYYVGVSGRIGKNTGESPKQMYFDSLVPNLDNSVFNVSSIYDKERFGHNGFSYDYIPFCEFSKDIVFGRKKFKDFVQYKEILPYQMLPDVNSSPKLDELIDEIFDLARYLGDLKQKDYEARVCENYRLKKAGITNYSV